MVVFPGGHGLLYLIPDFDRGYRRMNWGIYSAVPPQLSFSAPTSLPPGSVGDELAAILDGILTTRLPPYWADIMRHSTREELSLQPVYDVAISSYVSNRVVLAGDAGTTSRPHTGSGATKALQDAMTLERACRSSGDWEQALAVYDSERCAAGNALVTLGQHLGRAQVEDTPPWDSMTAADFEVWWTHSALAGGRIPYDS
jgi:2-polyprenyl-6-methoxyphenol hydroxylase-like FAD-dependent oxidoreductase